MTRRVNVIVAAHVVVAAAVAVVAARAGWHAAAWQAIGLGAGFGVLGFFPMRLELHGGRCTITPTYVLLPVAVLTVGPLAVGVCAAVGEAAWLVAYRIAPVKVAFNVASRFIAAVSGALVVHGLFGTPGATDALALVAVIGAVLVYELVSLVSTSIVLAAVAGRPAREVAAQTGVTSLLAASAVAPLGIAALELSTRAPFGPVVLVPLVVGVAFTIRRNALLHDEHLRVERLYGTFSRTARLRGIEETARAVADETRDLLTATEAVCCIRTPTGWEGVAASTTGSWSLPRADVAALVGLARGRDAYEVDGAQAADRLPRPRPTGSLVVASAPDTSRVPVVLVAFRDLPTDGGARARVDTLRAFAAQAALAVANAQLLDEVKEALQRQVDLNRQKGEFVAAVSHELRTPLAATLTAVETVLRLEQLDPQRRAAVLERAMVEGRRLQRLIDDLLLIAAAEHTAVDPEPEPTRVRDVLDDVVATIGTVYHRAPTVEGTAWDDLVVDVDRHKLRQIVFNLVENAMKYAGGSDVAIRVRARDDEFQVDVVDHGPGIPPDQRERVFDRFVQLDQSATRERGGTGLGLYLCRRLAGVLSGTLALSGTDGGGATFTLALPRTPRAARARSPHPSPGGPTPHLVAAEEQR